MKQHTVKTLKWLGIVAVVLAIAYAILAFAANRSLSRAYAALETDGRPIELEGIIPPKIPDSDNAALVYRRVVLQLKAEKAENGGEKSLWDALSEVPADAKKQANPDDPAPELVERFKQLYYHPVVVEALADLEAGSRKSGYRNNLDYSKGFYMEVPHLGELRSLTKILCYHARFQAAAGNHADAWNSILTALRVADAMKDEPFLVTQLSRAAQLRMVVDAIQDLPSNAAIPAEADALLAAGENPAPWAAAMDGERIIYGEYAFRITQSDRRMLISQVMSPGEVEARPSRVVAFLYVIIEPLSRFDHAAHITNTHGMAQEMLKPYSEEGVEAIRQQRHLLPWYCMLNRIMIPSLEIARTKQVDLAAQIRVTRAGLAVLQHRDEQGAWPDALPKKAELVDPFTGEPLLYRPGSDGFVLYSVGANGVDDNGTLGKDRAGDIVWKYSAE